MVKYHVLCHSSIRIETDEVIYFDPFKINKTVNDADIVFITHSHYDHYSIEDIRKVDNGKTLYVMPLSMKKEANALSKKRIVFVEPNKSYDVDGIKVDVTPAYNINKPFHKEEFKWVGYVLTLENKKYYVMGDTDETKEALKVKCDYLFIPIGGTYTMDYNDAAICANRIKPSVVIPTHYGLIVGDMHDGAKFSSLIDKTINVDLEIR